MDSDIERREQELDSLASSIIDIFKEKDLELFEVEYVIAKLNLKVKSSNISHILKIRKNFCK